MRKFTLLFTMLALSMGFSMARADVVSPYTYNFEGLSTSSTDFAPAGWGHVVDGYDGYGDFYYVDYQLRESGGYGDTAPICTLGHKPWATDPGIREQSPICLSRHRLPAMRASM